MILCKGSDNATVIGERGISACRLGYADCFFVGRCGAHNGEMVGVFFDLMFGLNRCVFLYMFTANLLKNAKKSEKSLKKWQKKGNFIIFFVISSRKTAKVE